MDCNDVKMSRGFLGWGGVSEEGLGVDVGGEKIQIGPIQTKITLGAFS